MRKRTRSNVIRPGKFNREIGTQILLVAGSAEQRIAKHHPNALEEMRKNEISRALSKLDHLDVGAVRVAGRAAISKFKKPKPATLHSLSKPPSINEQVDAIMTRLRRFEIRIPDFVVLFATIRLEEKTNGLLQRLSDRLNIR